MATAKGPAAPIRKAFLYIGIAVCAGLPFVLLDRNLAAQQATPKSASSSTEPGVAPSQELNPPRIKATLADFAWLSGRWHGTWGPRYAEQLWMEPRAGTMLGVLRLNESDKTLVMELFTLLEKPDGIELRTRHFTPSLTPWEKSGASSLALTSLDQKRAVFENLADGNPARTIITRIDPDTFISRAEITTGGETQATEITYHREK